MKSKENKPAGIVKKTSNTPFFPKQKKAINPVAQVRKKAIQRLTRAHQYLNGNSPLESRTKKSRGLELAKKMISPAIQQIETISAVLQNMIRILSAGNAVAVDLTGKEQAAAINKTDTILLQESFFDKDQEAQVRKLIQEAAGKTVLGNTGSEGFNTIYDCNKEEGQQVQMPYAWANYIHCLLTLPKDKSEIIIETIPGREEEEEIEEEEIEDGGEDNGEEEVIEPFNERNHSNRNPADNPGPVTEESVGNSTSTWRRFLNRFLNN